MNISVPLVTNIAVPTLDVYSTPLNVDSANISWQ